MPPADRRDPGSAGFDWSNYVDWMISSAGSLAAVADRLSARRGYKDEVASVERALRRLRARGSLGGGTWGARALATFGLPDAVHQRVRWLGQYHARFTDLPVPMCADLIRAWNKPPTTDSSVGRAWLALGCASLAMRDRDLVGALTHLDRARTDLAVAPVAAQIEAILGRAYIASRSAPSHAESILVDVPAMLADVDDPHDRACLHARWIDHRAYELNRHDDHAASEALYRSIPLDAPSFALARRMSGLAYVHWKRSAIDVAAEHARAAAEHAGDGGHVRARAMALSLLARITDDPEARRRAIAMSRQLEDETMLVRLGVHPPSRID